MEAEFNVGLVGFLAGGALVLFGYSLREKSIRETAEPMRHRPSVYMLWLVSALIAAVSYLALLVLWSQDLATNDSRLFITGLYIFITGACSWSFTLSAESLTTSEFASLLNTAIGSVVMAAAARRDGSVYPAVYLVFHHVAVDLMWWSAYGRTKLYEHTGFGTSFYLAGCNVYFVCTALFLAYGNNINCVIGSAFALVIIGLYNTAMKQDPLTL